MLEEQNILKKNKKLITTIIIITFGVFVAFFIAIRYFQNYFYNYAVGRKNENNENKENKENKIKGESRYIYSYDNLKLHGYEYINENNSHNWAIVVHGYRGEGKNMWYISDEFIEKGYNTLTVDNRGHGKSEGNYIGMGWHDRLDIIEWIKKIINEDKDANIVLYGVSMGAATVLMTAGEELPENVKVIIADSGYTSINEIMKYQGSKQYKYVCSNMTLPIVDKMVKAKAGYTFKEGSTVKQVEKTSKPILFIHGDQDDFVPVYMVYELYEHAASDKELLIIKNAEHGDAYYIDKDLYLKTMWQFIKKYVA